MLVALRSDEARGQQETDGEEGMTGHKRLRGRKVTEAPRGAP
jgi:hypothetical protein